MDERDRGRVFVGVSRSLAGLAALRYAVGQARLRGVPLCAVRTWWLKPSWVGPEDLRWREQLAEEAARYVGEAFAEAMGGVPADVPVRVIVREGRTDLALSGLAAGPRDLLVLGCGTRRRWQSWIVRGCTRNAACPVTVVPLSGLAREASEETLVRRLLREAR